MRSSPFAATAAAEEAARRELEDQAAFMFRKLHILEKHEAFILDRAANAGVSSSPAAEVENRRIQSFVNSSAANLKKLREAAAGKKISGGGGMRRPSRYEIEIIKSRRHVASFAAVAALRETEAQQRSSIDQEQGSLRMQLVRLYLKNLTQGLRSVKIATERQLRPPNNVLSVQ
jgi:hypothetical protein